MVGAQMSFRRHISQDLYSSNLLARRDGVMGAKQMVKSKRRRLNKVKT